MQRSLVFVPTSLEEARQLAGAPFTEPRQAFAVTPDLLAALDFGPDQGEEAERGALVLASVWGLTQWGERCVVVAEVPEADVDRTEQHETGNGGVGLARLDTGSVVSAYADEAGLDLTTAAAASRGLDVDAAWDAPQVQALVTEHHLLWHDASELALLGRESAATSGGGH